MDFKIQPVPLWEHRSTAAERRRRRSLNSAALPTTRHPRLPSTPRYQLSAGL